MVQALKDFIFGMTGYGFARHALETRRELESIFMVVALGDLVGLPVMPPVYALRFLPHVAPEIQKWKLRMARHKEVWEREEFDLHGM
jgi:hypothetical protein